MVFARELAWGADLLGEGYEQFILELGEDPDGEGRIQAVLVRHLPPTTPRGAVLYVHGFAEYFFQTALADFFAERGYAFYALDLRKCGRARGKGHTAHHVTDLEFYDVEFEAALGIITDAHPGVPVLIGGHSTGGLTTPLWLDRRRRRGRVSPVAGLFLNSPWFDLGLHPVRRAAVTAGVALAAKVGPMRVLPVASSPYVDTLHVSTGGEWDFDMTMKPRAGFPVTAGWLAAVRRGHRRLHEGLDVGVPSLVLRSDRSHRSPERTEDSETADTVLSVAAIARWSGCLGNRGWVVPVPGARHDVFLSRPQARAQAYAELDRWLNLEIGPDKLDWRT